MLCLWPLPPPHSRYVLLALSLATLAMSPPLFHNLTIPFHPRNLLYLPPLP